MNSTAKLDRLQFPIHHINHINHIYNMKRLVLLKRNSHHFLLDRMRGEVEEEEEGAKKRSFQVEPARAGLGRRQRRRAKHHVDLKPLMSLLVNFVKAKTQRAEEDGQVAVIRHLRAVIWKNHANWAPWPTLRHAIPVRASQQRLYLTFDALPSHLLFAFAAVKPFSTSLTCLLATLAWRTLVKSEHRSDSCTNLYRRRNERRATR